MLNLESDSGAEVWRAEVSGQVDRILRSAAFQGSEALRQLLAYLGKRAIEQSSEPVKVREIAAAVFGRAEDFNPQTDSIVRVHTGRLRLKLAEYYLGPGADDPVFITIPKGSYALAFSHKETPDVALESREAAIPATVEAAPASGRHVPWRMLLIVVLTLAALGAAATLTLQESRNRPSSEAVGAFWKPFVAADEPPLIVFSNFTLAGSLQTELRESKTSAAGDPIIDTYTTVGEVMGVFEVTRLLAQFGKSARVKRGTLLTWDEDRDSNLIFVGGPLAATPLREVPFFRDFEFRSPGEHGPAGVIANLRPKPGEQPLYRGPEVRPYRFDYALIALGPSANRSRQALVLAGITEYGTQAAAEFVTREQTVRELLKRLKVSHKQPVPSFEAVIRTVITAGVPIRSEIVAVHLTR